MSGGQDFAEWGVVEVDDGVSQHQPEPDLWSLELWEERFDLGGSE